MPHPELCQGQGQNSGVSCSSLTPSWVIFCLCHYCLGAPTVQVHYFPRWNLASRKQHWKKQNNPGGAIRGNYGNPGLALWGWSGFEDGVWNGEAGSCWSFSWYLGQLGFASRSVKREMGHQPTRLELGSISGLTLEAPSLQGRWRRCSSAGAMPAGEWPEAVEGPGVVSRTRRAT